MTNFSNLYPVTYVYGTPLDHHIALAHRLLHTVVQGQLNFAFENHAKVYALGTVFRVQVILADIFDGEKVADSAINTRRIDQRNHLAIVINEWFVDLGRNSDSPVDIRNPRAATLGWLSRGWIQGGQDVVDQEDSFAIGRVSCVTA